MLRAERIPYFLRRAEVFQGFNRGKSAAWYLQRESILQVWWAFRLAGRGRDFHRHGLWHMDKDWRLERKFLQVHIRQWCWESDPTETERPWLPKDKINRSQSLLRHKRWQLLSRFHGWRGDCTAARSRTYRRRVQWGPHFESLHSHCEVDWRLWSGEYGDFGSISVERSLERALLGRCPQPWRH